MLLLSVGHDLPYLTGYHAMPLERLTMLVVPRDGEATLVVPRLEAPRSTEQPGVFALRPGTRPRTRRRSSPSSSGRRATSASATRCGPGSSSSCSRTCPAPRSVAPSTWSAAADGEGRGRDRRPRAPPVPPPIVSPRSYRAARSRWSGAPRPRSPPTSRPARRGPRQGQLRHRRRRRERRQPAPPRRRSGHPAGEIVLCDFGGTMDGYCSDITRCVFTGEPPAEITEAYAVLHDAQQAGVAAAVVGTPCEEVDRVGPRGSSPMPATATTSSTAPATASGWRRTRTPTSSRATPARSPPGTPSASSPGSTSRADGGCGSRTSSSRPPPGPNRSTPPTTHSCRSDGAQLADSRGRRTWSAVHPAPVGVGQLDREVGAVVAGERAVSSAQ